MRHSILLATLSAVTGVVAQSQNFTINPALVPDGTKGSYGPDQIS